MGAGLARDDGLTVDTCVECETAIAGKPAPTGDRGCQLHRVQQRLCFFLQKRRTPTGVQVLTA
ncbi:hypothetical protein EJ576_04200 [Pseudomonas sp. C 49-2]|nr:hypothetical protein EJ576_04200 [Pseudomonas sp. C 49-2]